MKRKALIIVNDDGILEGISRDIQNITGFLTSLSGGSWHESEIDIIKNPTLHALRIKLATQHLLNLDFCLVFFSGHGGSDGRKTHIQINNQGETIEESSLFGFAKKQINFFDCCRAFSQRLAEASERKFSAEMFDSMGNNLISPIQSRKIYEDLINQAIDQNPIFYSCELKEVSYDSPDGAVYLTSYLKNALEYSMYSSEKAKLAIQVHQMATRYVKSLNPRPDGDQNPTYVYSRAGSRVEDYLPISINPFISAYNRPMFG